jgi:hypothetical protein
MYIQTEAETQVVEIYKHFQIYAVLTTELQSFSNEAYIQYKNLLHDGNTCFLSLLTVESNVKIHGHYSYGCNRSLRRKTIHRLLAHVLAVLWTVLSYGNFLSWHIIAGMNELLYFFFGGSTESYNSFV